MPEATRGFSSVHFLFPVLQMVAKVLAKMATKASLRWAPPRCQAQFDIVYMMHLLNPHEQPCKVLADIYL